MGTREHKKNTPRAVTLAILSLSTTRTLADDQSGAWMSRKAREAGHSVVSHEVVPDDRSAIKDALQAVIRRHRPQVLLLTGGTGIAPRDVTIEAVRPLFAKELTSFSALFSQLSFQEIGSAAMLSRATAGIIEQTIVFCMPGSLNACKLACKTLIFPELGHLVKHVCEG